MSKRAYRWHARLLALYEAMEAAAARGDETAEELLDLTSELVEAAYVLMTIEQDEADSYDDADADADADADDGEGSAPRSVPEQLDWIYDEVEPGAGRSQRRR